MARGRLISRTLGSSRRFAALLSAAGDIGEFAQALYPLLVANSDDFGRLEGDAFTVKHAVFPTSPRGFDDFARALDAMRTVGLIDRYVANSHEVVSIVDFDGHQPGLTKRTKSKFPAPPVNFTEIPSEEKRTEEKRTEPNCASRALAGFDAFWAIYPKKRSRADAEKAWRKLAPSPELFQRIQAAIAVQGRTPEWRKDGGQFVPYPATYLNGRRWEDVDTPESAPAAEPVDWWTDCRQRHGGACNGRYAHHVQCQLDEAKAAAS